MADFDWVTARANCSLVGVYERLREQVRRDVEILESLQADAARTNRLEFHSNEDGFRVTTRRGKSSLLIRFVLRETAVEVSNIEGTVTLSGAATLSDDGQCRLRVDGRDVELWQFRKRALESFFFDS